MIPQIRLRWHTDGRVAISGPSGYWLVIGAQGHWVANEPYVSHSGWSELLVAELPEPDGHEPDQASTPRWTPERFAFTLKAYPDEVIVTHIGDMYSATAHYKTDAQLAELRADALKMLAAIAACEQYRAQRETT